jgi:hypothetical protein
MHGTVFADPKSKNHIETDVADRVTFLLSGRKTASTAGAGTYVQNAIKSDEKGSELNTLIAARGTQEHSRMTSPKTSHYYHV